MTWDNPLIRIPLIFDLGITLLMVLLSAGAGFRLLRWLRVSLDNPLERGLFAVTLGLGALSYVPFVLFSVGLGKPPVVAGATFLLFLIFLPDAVRVSRSAWRVLKASANEAPPWAGLLFLALLPLLLTTLLGALCPPADPDGLYYHLTAPLWYLREGRFFYMPTFLHVHWPISVEMLFGVGMAFKQTYAACMVQYVFGILLLLAVYALGRRIANGAAGWIAACLLFPFLRGEMNWAFNDLGIALYTVMAAYAVFLAAGPPAEGLNPPDKFALWRLATICAGLSATAKLPGLLTVGIVSLMAFVSFYSTRTGKAAHLSLSLFGIGLLVVLPWFVRSWALTGSPLYPYLGGLFGAKDWSPEWQARLTEYFQVFNTFRAQQLTAAQVFQVRAITCFLLAGVGFAMYTWRGARPVRPLVAMLFLLLFVQVATSGIYYRFLLPMVPLALALAVWLIRTPLARWEAARWVAVVLVIVVLWEGHRVSRMIDNEIGRIERTLPVALGGVSRDAYLRQGVRFYPTIQWCNANLLPDAIVVLGVSDAHAALFERRTLSTHLYTQNALRFDTYENLLADLKRLGATHIILQESYLLLGAIGQKDTELSRRDREEFPKLRRVCAEYGKSLFSEQGYTVYALNLP